MMVGCFITIDVGKTRYFNAEMNQRLWHTGAVAWFLKNESVIVGMDPTPPFWPPSVSKNF